MDNRSNLIIEVQRCSDGVSNGSDITNPFLRGLVNNSVREGSGGGTVQGGSQADTLTGSSGDDSLSSCQGHDTLQGSSSDDVLNGDHLLLKDLDYNIKTTLLNTSSNDLLGHQPNLI